jgi:hypothetical protein
VNRTKTECKRIRVVDARAPDEREPWVVKAPKIVLMPAKLTPTDEDARKQLAELARNAKPLREVERRRR